MSIEKECNRKKDKEWLEARKTKRSKKERGRKGKEKDESFVERQVEDELEDLLIKTAFSTLL